MKYLGGQRRCSVLRRGNSIGISADVAAGKRFKKGQLMNVVVLHTGSDLTPRPN